MLTKLKKKKSTFQGKETFLLCSMLHVETIFLFTTCTQHKMILKRLYPTTPCLGPAEIKLKFFLFFAQLQAWVAYSDGAEWYIQQNKRIKMENEATPFSSWSFQINPEAHRRFYCHHLCSACMLCHWMGKSVITDTEFTRKTLVSGTMPAHKEMAHDFFLSVTEENVLSAAGKIVNLLLRIIKIKKNILQIDRKKTNIFAS